MHSCLHTCMDSCMHACMHAYVHTCIPTHMYTCMLACLNACMLACLHACIDTYIDTYIHYMSYHEATPQVIGSKCKVTAKRNGATFDVELARTSAFSIRNTDHFMNLVDILERQIKQKSSHDSMLPSLQVCTYVLCGCPCPFVCGVYVCKCIYAYSSMYVVCMCIYVYLHTS